MASSLDYLRWRGDLSFKEKPFNSVDASLLSSVIYLPIDKSAINHTLGEVAEKLSKLPSFQHQMHDETGAEVLLLTKSPRLGNITILDWTNKMEKDPYPLQFSAATFRLNSNTIIIAYRGTDSSIIGWNEDMNMSYMPKIYGQNVAAKYLNKIARKFQDDQIYLLGHSKGGNFAQYSLSVAKQQVQDRVIKALCFDGPGFFHKISSSSGFIRTISKMKTYLPEASVIGTMLDHPERTLIVKSTVPMRYQHDPRRWSVGRDSFVLAAGLTPGARIMRHALIHFNNSISEDKRSEMFSALFDAFESSNIKDVNQLTAHKIIGTYRLSRVIMSLDPKLRKVIISVFTDIWNSYRKNMNLPLIEKGYDFYPKSNDSKKGPVFFEFYDPATPNLKLPKEVEAKLNKKKGKSAK